MNSNENDSFECRVCRQAGIRVIDRIDSPNCEQPVPVCRCGRCGHFSLFPTQYQQQKAFEWDGVDYYLRNLDRREAATSQVLERLTAAYVSANGKKPASFLDVGCALGWSLRLAEEKGLRATGIEPEARLAEYGRDVLAVDVRHGKIGSGLAGNEVFDLVYCEQVLEHVGSPPDFLLHLKKRLAPRGLLYLGVPPLFPLIRMTTFLARKAKLPLPNSAMTDIFHDPDEHISVFSRRSMHHLAGLAGLRIRPLPLTRATITTKRVAKHLLASGANPGTWLLYRP